MTTPFYRVRFLLRATRDTSLPGQQGGMLHALLCKANGGGERPTAFPRDFMLDAPEQSRTRLRQGEPFAFGGTILASSPEQATAIASTLLRGIEREGRTGKPRGRGLGGNYLVEQCQDLVGGAGFNDSPLIPVPIEHISDEIQRLLDREEWTLQFLSPMRLLRTRPEREKHRSFFDDRHFDPRVLLRRQVGRLQALGIQLRQPQAAPELDLADVSVLENRLVWIDLGYGGQDGKVLGGVCGCLRIRIADPVLRAALVWGQYARVGKNTTFGFGRYRIEELGPEPFACDRGVSLLELAWRHPTLDRLAMTSGLEVGVLTRTFEDLRAGRYQPHPCARVEFGEGEDSRALRIPSRRDRVLQRAVLETVAPGVDQLFEASSFAWRKGLGRHSSAKAIRRAYRDGYQFAVRADFDRFFESIPHAHLFDKLEAYLADRQACELIRLWVTAAVKGDRGIPTGAPISPLLGNLMLDRFDEQIARRGGKLVRYGDDFLILCRDEARAESLLQAAAAEAARLEMRLNSDAQAAVDLSEPFEFLGFRFVRTDRWQRDGDGRPRRLEELKWFDAARKPSPSRRLHLPGETGQAASDFGLTAIIGPGATHLEIAGAEVRCHYAQGGKATAAPINELEWLIVLGAIGMSSQVVCRLTDARTNILLADERGQVLASIAGDSDASPEVVIAQVQARDDRSRVLAIARELVSAKLHNYGRLAAAANCHARRCG